MKFHKYLTNRFREKLKAIDVWAQKFPIYLMLSIMGPFSKNPKQSLLPTQLCLLPDLILEKPNEQI